MTAESQTGSAFATFRVRLGALHGEAGLAVRHELYFIAHPVSGPRGRLGQAVRAVAALLRDSWLLWLARGPRFSGFPPPILLVATLPGANGWGTVARARAALPAGAEAVAICHPRLGVGTVRDGIAAAWLPKPRLSALFTALSAASRHLARTDARISAVAVAATVARHVLWAAAWRKLLDGGSSVILLHNDFDMMSAAALDHGNQTCCLQHGIPTDEFFPVRAGLQCVWGPSSRDAYLQNGAMPEQLIMDSLGRGAASPFAAAPEPPAAEPPAGVALVSQGHTAIYGRDLARRLRDIAAQLARLLPGQVTVLLHPGEGRGSGYAGLSGVRLSSPPHVLLAPAQTAPWLVVGFSSTALLDADLAGHYVVSLDWSEAGSPAARAVAAAPRRAASAEAVVEVFRDLVHGADLRRIFRAEQAQWRGKTFTAHTGALAALLAEYTG